MSLYKGPQEGCLNSVTYASMIHLQTLQNYLRLVSARHSSLCTLFVHENTSIIPLTKEVIYSVKERQDF